MYIFSIFKTLGYSTDRKMIFEASSTKKHYTEIQNTRQGSTHRYPLMMMHRKSSLTSHRFTGPL